MDLGMNPQAHMGCGSRAGLRASSGDGSVSLPGASDTEQPDVEISVLPHPSSGRHAQHKKLLFPRFQSIPYFFTFNENPVPR